MSTEKNKTSERDDRIKKLNELRELGVNPYPVKANCSHKIKEVLDNFKKLEKSQENISIVGRLMNIREHGNLCFANLQDASGNIQLAISKKEVGAEEYKKFIRLIDIGDFVEVGGECFVTHKGEDSVLVKDWKILTKTLRPLPNKWSGLKDKEERYRRRYLDLIMNKDVKDVFAMRTQIINLLREFLNKEGFLEVETPVLQVLYGGTNARPFTTHINAYDMPMYLRVAPELYLKRLVVGGFDKVYEIARNFRNEGADQTHNPEFTMIEWYEAYGDYFTIMDRIERAIKYITRNLFGEESIKLNGEKIDISHEWPKLSLIDAILKYEKIDVEKMSDAELEKIIEKLDSDIIGEKTRGQMIFTIFDKLVCDKLIEPTWIVDYPKEVSPLAKAHRDNPELVERYELYFGGKEISDGWTEINDPIDQRNRFENEQKAMRAGDDEAHPMDEDFLESMEYGMPPTGGMGMGIDRLVMLLTDNWSIRDVLLFPTMKPKGLDSGEEGRERDTKVAVALVNKGLNLEPWQEMNTVAHLNAAFGARVGRSLFMQDKIKTKDDKEIKLNVQNAIIIKEIEDNQKILDFKEKCEELGLEIAEFTREMIETSSDEKVAEITKDKKLSDVEYLGVLVFGKKSVVEKITKDFKLFESFGDTLKKEDTEEKDNSSEDLGISYEQAQALVKEHITENATRLHSIESEAIMRALARREGENEEAWGIIGLLHDIDWDYTKDNTREHTVKSVEILKNAGASDFLIETIVSHGYGIEGCGVNPDKERNTKLQHLLVAAETLTGLIIASSLVRPDKDLKQVKLSSLKKKFKTKSFAANCNRETIKECEKAGISLDEFLEIGLKALQDISEKLK